NWDAPLALMARRILPKSCRITARFHSDGLAEHRPAVAYDLPGWMETICSCAGQSGRNSQLLQRKPGLGANCPLRMSAATSWTVSCASTSCFSSRVVTTEALVWRL